MRRSLARPRPLVPLLAAAAVLVAAPATAEEHRVSQREKVFAPAALTVRVGDEIEFLNDDEISHNVFSRSEAARFNLKIQRPGEHKTYRFEKPGSVVIRCAIHPKMKMTVQVEPPEEADVAETGVPSEGDPATSATARGEDAPAAPPAAPETP